jgi:hypothetical protein
MQHNWKLEQPERFTRAVKAACSTACYYPNCSCGGTPGEVEKAIEAWEAIDWEAPTHS